MNITSIFYRVAFSTLLLTLPFVSTSQAADVAVKGRSAPHSGIEQMQTFCTLSADADASRDVYDKFPGLAGMIESALDRNFTNKGFTKAAADKCDIEMRYTVATREGKLPSRKKYSAGTGALKDDKGKMRMSSLDFDAYNKSQNRRIWTGNAATTAAVHFDPNQKEAPDMENIQQRIDTAIDKLFMRFPARAK